MPPDPPPAKPPPTALGLFLIFGRIGLTSFGGGLSGWLLREFVQDRAWLTEEEFLNGLAISQALPGVNVKNMAIWIGYRLAGSGGAIASVAGIIVPPAIVIVLIAMALAQLQRFSVTHLALEGAAAASIGLSLSMGIVTARRVPRAALPLSVMTATFVMVGLLRWPLVWVLVSLGCASVCAEYLRLRRVS
jgi:chromate transporter